MMIDPDHEDEPYCETCVHRHVLDYCDECVPSLYETEHDRAESIKVAHQFLRLIIAGVVHQALENELERRTREADK